MLRDLEMNIVIRRNGQKDKKNIYRVRSIDSANNKVYFYNGDSIEEINVECIEAIDIRSKIPTMVITKRGELKRDPFERRSREVAGH